MVVRGHPPPLLIGAAGVRLLSCPAGVMLGAVPAARARYADAHAEVEPDDVLVLYTDGLIERRDRDLDEGSPPSPGRRATSAASPPRPSARR